MRTVSIFLNDFQSIDGRFVSHHVVQSKWSVLLNPGKKNEMGERERESQE